MSMHIRLSPLRDLFNVYSLKAFIILCVLWFSSSAITSTTAKLVITKHDFPITLTLVQFAFISVALLCFNQFGIFIKILPVCRNSLSYSAYLSVLQIIGHVLSSAAISYVTVSFHHTIKVASFQWTLLIY